MAGHVTEDSNLGSDVERGIVECEKYIDAEIKLMQLDKQRRNIVVTGANDGMGCTLCENLCHYQVACNVIVTGVTLASATDAVQRILKVHPYAYDKVYPFKLNVVEPDSVAAFVKWFKEHEEFKGRIDCLVHNAATGTMYDMMEKLDPTIPWDEDCYKTIFDVNYRSIVKNNAFFLPMLTRDAKVINVGSI
jgi:NAD(P)-dependent dehydrogenase (short-subunit alcohol dehydrogenase family)